MPEKLVATALLANVPSQKILESAGFIKAEIITKYGAQRCLYNLPISQPYHQYQHRFFHQAEILKKGGQSDMPKNNNDPSKREKDDHSKTSSLLDQKIIHRTRL